MEEVQYASVVIKSKRQPRAKKKEEVVYDEVKINPTVQQTSDKNGLLSDKEAERYWYQKLACCFVGLCAILVLTIIGGCVYFVFLHKYNEQELNQLKANQAALLEENTNLTQQTQNLTLELSQVKEKNYNLTDQIEIMQKKVSLTQWSIKEYCLTRNNERKCGFCETGWEYCRLSCYAVNNAQHENQKTWEEARADCRRKNSDLTVVSNEKEKTFVDGTSWVDKNIKGYWIGLRAAEGKWKWIDGSELTNQGWIQQQPANDGQCVTSLQNREWRSVSCYEKNAWICEKMVL